MRCKRSFSLYLSEKAFFPILFAKYLSQSYQFEQQKKIKFHFSLKSTYHNTLRTSNFRGAITALSSGSSSTETLNCLNRNTTFTNQRMYYVRTVF